MMYHHRPKRKKFLLLIIICCCYFNIIYQRLYLLRDSLLHPNLSSWRWLYDYGGLSSFLHVTRPSQCCSTSSFHWVIDSIIAIREGRGCSNWMGILAFSCATWGHENEIISFNQPSTNYGIIHFLGLSFQIKNNNNSQKRLTGVSHQSPMWLDLWTACHSQLSAPTNETNKMHITVDIIEVEGNR